MTISELDKAIEDMKKIYPFENDLSTIRFIDDARFSTRRLEVTTFAEDGAKITLTKAISATPTSVEKRSL